MDRLPALRIKKPHALAAMVTLLAASASLAHAAPAACAPVRLGDRVLLVSTRPVGCTTSPERMAAGVYAAELTDGGSCPRWVETPFDSLMASLDPSLPVVFYVHGNQITASAARQRGRDVYRRLIRCACDERPIQFVVFSWCSDKVKGLMRDYREKAARTRPVAWQLAWVMDRLPSGARVGVLAYSYGARVASGAAHLMAGGSMSGLRYEPLSGDCRACGPASIRAVFLAAAYDACWNARGRYHGMALERIDSLLVTIDRKDPAMKFFKWVSTTSDPPAMGGVGPRGLDRWQASKVSVRNVVSAVGRSHDLYDYLATPGLMRSSWRRLTFADTPLAEPTLVEPAGTPELAEPAEAPVL